LLKRRVLVVETDVWTLAHLLIVGNLRLKFFIEFLPL